MKIKKNYQDTKATSLSGFKKVKEFGSEKVAFKMWPGDRLFFRSIGQIREDFADCFEVNFGESGVTLRAKKHLHILVQGVHPLKIGAQKLITYRALLKGMVEPLYLRKPIICPRARELIFQLSGVKPFFLPEYASQEIFIYDHEVFLCLDDEAVERKSFVVLSKEQLFRAGINLSAEKTVKKIFYLECVGRDDGNEMNFRLSLARPDFVANQTLFYREPVFGAKRFAPYAVFRVAYNSLGLVLSLELIEQERSQYVDSVVYGPGEKLSRFDFLPLDIWRILEVENESRQTSLSE